LQRRDVLGRIGLALLAAVAVTVVIKAWNPPFAFRTGYTPDRDIVASVPFTVVNTSKTDSARQRARDQIRGVYTQDPGRLVEIRRTVRAEISQLTAAESLADLKEQDQKLWQSYQLPPDAGGAAEQQQGREEQFQEFRTALAGEENLALLDAAFAPFEQRGLLKKLADESEKGIQQEILVHPAGQSEPLPVVKVSEVLIGDGSALKVALGEQFQASGVVKRLFVRIWPDWRKAVTLVPDLAMAQRLQNEAAEAVPDVTDNYEVGQPLVEAEETLDGQKLQLLRAEYDAMLAERAASGKFAQFVRAATVLLLVFGLFILCGIYMHYCQPEPLTSFTRLCVILSLAVIVVALSRWASADAWRAEIIPLMVFGMTIAIAYRRELALLLSGVVALMLVLAVGQGLSEYLMLMAVTTTAAMNMRHIRSRSKLIYVGLAAGVVAAVLNVALGLIEGQPLNWPLLSGAVRTGLWALSAGFLMTGLLPFIEHLFGVLTDLSLLELVDVAHPLFQELVRRAPSTYNHSITVGSIAEAAAESIGGRGLLVRVGAYFHDIGKMLKPGYFIENQGPEDNRHATLVPAMSSLVIVAHIKDGADLARSHHLPQPIIDLIEQHHGTTLVGFFYERASAQKQADPNGGEVEESTYRYPGPRPQTKEAAVLMLADSVESASRTLVDPTPKRIERLVRELAEQRLRGGQFDESGLTLRELRTIERYMVMSLTSIYHGRIKYPDQRTA